MRAISLFSGVGGFEIGFERADIETVLQAEQDPWCLEVLARHWPETERVTDVRSVGVHYWRQRGSMGSLYVEGSADATEPSTDGYEPSANSDIDLVYGGFPCTDLSVAGKRAGLGGERSGLWFEFYRVLSELRPRWAVIENVKGFLSGCGCAICIAVGVRRRRHLAELGRRCRDRQCAICVSAKRVLEAHSGHSFGIVFAGLAELGFDAAWAVLDAQHFNVPQRRERVFIVAGPRGRGAEQVLSLCESCGGNPETGRASGEGVAYTLAAGVRGTGDGHGRHDLDHDTYVTAIRTANTGANGHGIAEDVAHTLDGAQGQAIIASALSASMGHHGHSSPRGDGADNLIPEIAWALQERDAKGPDSSTKDGHLLPLDGGVRRLTPLECNRLQGFPDDWDRWTADGREIADSHRFRMMGNAVAVPCLEWIGHRLMAVDALMREEV